MKEFVRSEELCVKMFTEAFDRDVRQDALIQIIWNHQHKKYKAYSADTGTYLQFPTKLRQRDAKYIADIVKAKKDDGKIFYRVFKGSCRDFSSGEVVW